MVRARQETQTELLHRRYARALKALSDFRTDAAFFHHTESPITYELLSEEIDKLGDNFKKNVFDVLPSAKILQ